jgi:DNA-binding GntR family transcriptional regulator
MQSSGKRSRASDVYERLRRDILGGELIPGDRLIFPELGRRYGASVGAIREALVRLTERGLVSFEPNFGFRVTPISVEAHLELTDARAELEALAVRRALADGSLAWESNLVAAAHRLAQTRRDPPGDAWQLAHADFHLALIEGCANRYLLAAAQALRERAELYRRWSEPEVIEAPHLEDDEHKSLVRAAVARDADTTEQLLRKHIAFTRGLRLRLPPQAPKSQ